MTVAERVVRVESPQGLHARPATEFAKRAAQFGSTVLVTKGAATADAKSVLMLLTLDVRSGDRITLRANGDDAQRAVDELAHLAERA